MLRTPQEPRNTIERHVRTAAATWKRDMAVKLGKCKKTSFLAPKKFFRPKFRRLPAERQDVIVEYRFRAACTFSETSNEPFPRSRFLQARPK